MKIDVYICQPSYFRNAAVESKVETIFDVDLPALFQFLQFLSIYHGAEKRQLPSHNVAETLSSRNWCSGL